MTSPNNNKSVSLGEFLIIENPKLFYQLSVFKIAIFPEKHLYHLRMILPSSNSTFYSVLKVVLQLTSFCL